MLFKLTNKRSNRSTHAGVLEFVAEEGKVYFPYWVMAGEFTYVNKFPMSMILHCYNFNVSIITLMLILL